LANQTAAELSTPIGERNVNAVLKKLVETMALFAAMTITEIDDAIVRFVQWLINDPAGQSWIGRKWGAIPTGPEAMMQLQAGDDPELTTLIQRFEDTPEAKAEALKFDGSRLPKILAAITQVLAFLKSIGIIKDPAPTPGT
jgi:hypothetical protein